jgi:hypothetical protein
LTFPSKYVFTLIMSLLLFDARCFWTRVWRKQDRVSRCRRLGPLEQSNLNLT